MTDNQEQSNRVPAGGFSLVVGACFTFNYIMGTGFVTLPYAFHEAGIVLSAAVMAIVCIAAKFGSDYTLSAMARAEHLGSLSENKKQGGKEGRGASGVDDAMPKWTGGCDGEGSSVVGASIEGRLEGGGSPEKVPPVHADEEGNLLIGTQRRFDLPELCRIFLGDFGFKAYSVANGLHLYGLLWVYTSVFAHAMDRVMPIFGAEGGDSYPMWVLIFAIIVVPMSVMELSEQAAVQVFLSLCRVVVAILMAVTPIVAALVADHSAMTVDTHENKFIVGNPHFDDQLEPLGSPLFWFPGFHRMFPLVSFSTVFHHAVPAIASAMSDKLQTGKVLGMTLLLCGAVFCLIGGIGSWYFGDRIEESANLNWNEYHAGTGHIVFDETTNKLTREGIAWWATAISLYIVLFPAIDVISVFPLNAFCLGNTLKTAFFGSEFHIVERNISTMFRFFACYPPLVGALFARDLGKIAGFTGLMGIAIQFCFPSLLYIASERKNAQLGLRTRTHYEGLGSSIPVATSVFILGCSSILSVFLIFCING